MSEMATDARKVRWGILGTGNIARAFCDALRTSALGELVAVGSRTPQAAERFGAEFGAQRRHGSYEALVADPEVDAVYVALPNHLHLPWIIACAQAGKHILCEKPLTINQAEAMVAIEVAHYHDVFLMEALMYRCHPQTARLAGLIREGAIGEVRLIEAHFSFNQGAINPEVYRQQSACGGGGILDVGCYCTSAARLIAGAAQGRDVAEPLEVKGCGHVDANTRVDQWAGAVCRFPGDVVATLTCGILVNEESRIRVWGSQGSIEVPNPWFPGRKGEAVLLLKRQGAAEPARIEVEVPAGLYTIEADTVAANLERRQAPPPCMTWNDTLGNMRALDLWRQSIGLTFDCEQEAALRRPFTIAPSARRPLPRMRYGEVEGVGKPISRLVLGTMVLARADIAFTCALLDHFVELGGNCFDTAYVYRTEAILGRWLKLRNNRERMVVIGKGAHTPHCHPEGLTRELLETLQRLDSEYVDLYLLHRDNPRVPVGEFVDCLDEHRRAGRIRAYGGSNWSLERLEEANAYAVRHGRTPFAASSPNLALAVWNEPMWAGCVAASDPASRAWYQRTQMPLFAWSSQASGFFTGRYRPEDASDPACAEVARTWFNDANWQRLERAQDLAARKGVTATQVALAYVLEQPLNVFALIGPRTLEETRTSAQALEVRLKPEELAWLNLEA
ncbi:MAG: aldo/keto reductase [Anaerolineae bacterium]